jgi:hypothetical protein
MAITSLIRLAIVIVILVVLGLTSGLAWGAM